MAIQQLSCPHCGGVFQVDTAYAGQQASCPHCQGGVMIPADPGVAPSQPMDYSAGMAAAPGQYGYAPQQPGAVQPTQPTQYPTAPETSSSLSCSVCGGLFQVSSTMVGQQVSCPHCNTVVTVPAVQPTGPAMSPGPDLSLGPGMSPGAPMTPGVVPGSTVPQPMAPGPAAPGPVTPSVPVAPQDPTGAVPTTGPVPQTPAYTPEQQAPPGGPGTVPVTEQTVVRQKPTSPKTPVPAALKNKAPGSPATSQAPSGAKTTTPSTEKKAAPLTTPGAASSSPADSTSMYPPGVKDKSPREPSPEKTKPVTQKPRPETPPAKTPAIEPAQPVKAREEKQAPPAEPEKKPVAKQPVQADSKTEFGNKAEIPTPPTASEAAGKAADAMLPPVAIEIPKSDAAPAASAKVDSLLPPGADTPASRPLPLTPQQLESTTGSAASPVFQSEAAGIPTDDGGFVKLREPVKTVEVGGEEVELHRLTPEERSRRRFFKNIIMAIIGIGILVGLGLFLKSFSK